MRRNTQHATAATMSAYLSSAHVRPSIGSAATGACGEAQQTSGKKRRSYL